MVLKFCCLSSKYQDKRKIDQGGKDRTKTQSGKNIQIFFDFANFYKRFIQNFCKIAVSLTSMLQIIGDNDLSTQASKNKANHNALSTITSNSAAGGSSIVDRDIENLSTDKKLAKFKKSNLAKAKNLNFIEAKSFGTEFFTFELKRLLSTYKKPLPKH